MLKLRSVNNVVIAPARTGRDNNNSTAVTKTAQANNGKRAIVIPRALILIIVTIKLIAPAIDEAPAKWRLKIAKSTEGPECAWILLNGG